MSGIFDSESCNHSSNASMLPLMNSSASGTVPLHLAHPAGITGEKETFVPLSRKYLYSSACLEAVSADMVELTEYLLSFEDKVPRTFSTSPSLRMLLYGPS